MVETLRKMVSTIRNNRRRIPLVTAFKGMIWMVIVLIIDNGVEELSELDEFLAHSSIEVLLLNLPILKFFDRFLKLEKTSTIYHGK